MTQSTTVDFQMSGLSMEKIQLQEGFVPYQAKVFGLMRKVEDTGGLYLSMLTTKRETSTLEPGMMIHKNTANLLVLTFYSTLRTLESLLRELLKLIKKEFTLTLR